MKTWEDLKRLYIDDHCSKDLKKPGIRLNALSSVDTLLNKNFPEIIDNPEILITLDKQEFMVRLAKYKEGKLSSAEKSVITGLMKFLNKVDETETTNSKDIEAAEPGSTPVGPIVDVGFDFSLLNVADPNRSEKESSYRKIGDAVNEVLQSRGYQTGNYHISEFLNWLPVTPAKMNFARHWKELCEVYLYLNGSKLELDKILQKSSHELRSGTQEADVFFYEPFQMIVEFDEDQHFNQFRGMTLKSDFYKGYPGFKMGEYIRLSRTIIQPGSKKSGFNYLKSPDPLFPENPGNQRQDNRHRQRAFRDFLKDVIANEKGIKPTVRIPSELIKNKRNFLNDKDIEKIKEYLLKLPLFNDFEKY
jgi:hypothetical protein